MADSFLQRLLNEGHLRDLGEDPTRFDALTHAVQNLSAELATDEGRAHVVPFTIVALDESTPPNDPAFERLAAAIVKHWTTYGNVYKGDPPCQLLRMVALAAVQDAARVDDRVAAAAWFTAANQLSVSPTEKEVVRSFVLELAETAEAAATEVWKRPEAEPSFRMPSRSEAAAASLTGFTLKRDYVSEEVENALTTQSESLQLRDSRTGTTNQPDMWAGAVAPVLSSAIAKAVDGGTSLLLKRINEAGLVSTEGMKDFASSVGDKVREALAEAQQAWSGRDLRSDLLWWRQSLYSPSLRDSYRSLGSRRAALAMAVDLHSLVPVFTPLSVEFMLREAVRACGLDETLSLVDLVEEARSHSDLWAAVYRASASSEQRRLPALTVALADADVPADWLGPVSSKPLSIADASVWVFRELQAARLVAHS